LALPSKNFPKILRFFLRRFAKIASVCAVWRTVSAEWRKEPEKPQKHWAVLSAALQNRSQKSESFLMVCLYSEARTFFQNSASGTGRKNGGGGTLFYSSFLSLAVLTQAHPFADGKLELPF